MCTTGGAGGGAAALVTLVWPPLSWRDHAAQYMQGDTDASTFYVLERGSADVRIHKEEWGEERKVHTYQPGR